MDILPLHSLTSDYSGARPHFLQHLTLAHSNPPHLHTCWQAHSSSSRRGCSSATSTTASSSAPRLYLRTWWVPWGGGGVEGREGGREEGGGKRPHHPSRQVRGGRGVEGREGGGRARWEGRGGDKRPRHRPSLTTTPTAAPIPRLAVVLIARLALLICALRPLPPPPSPPSPLPLPPVLACATSSWKAERVIPLARALRQWASQSRS